MCFTRFGEQDQSGTIVTIEDSIIDGTDTTDLDPEIIISPGPSPFPYETKGLILGLISGICAGTAYTIV